MLAGATGPTSPFQVGHRTRLLRTSVSRVLVGCFAHNHLRITIAVATTYQQVAPIIVNYIELEFSPHPLGFNLLCHLDDLSRVVMNVRVYTIANNGCYAGG